jgi:prepilin-type N-terminal cleavage/methylation domain-containing protein
VPKQIDDLSRYLQTMLSKRKMSERLRVEDGFTLVELMVASMMGVILLGVAGSLVLSAMKDQPQLSKRANNISTARWVTERLTREIRNGIAVDKATPSSVSFRTYVRRTSCGSGTIPASASPAIKCEVTYACTTTSCSRTETAPEVLSGGTPTKIFSGIDNSNVFCYVPSSEKDQLSCGPAPEALSTITYVGVTLHIPNSSGPGLTVSDGASLRNAVLKN